ncbi:MAG: hypothetical protein HFJ17_00800 [Clostridia bacterium]|nr:hypothetical protein [Clostridia bacterium]
MQQYSEKKVKELIKKFDLELISFELDIPMEVLNQYKKEIEEDEKNKNNNKKDDKDDKDKKSDEDKVEKQQPKPVRQIVSNRLGVKRVEEKVQTASSYINEKNKTVQFNIKEMRIKFKTLFYKNYSSKPAERKEMSEAENEKVENLIKDIEEKIKNMQNISKDNRWKTIKDILKEIIEIKDYNITSSQAEKLYQLIDSQVINALKLSFDDKMSHSLNRVKGQIVRQLSNAIEFESGQTSDIEELKNLREKITGQMSKEYTLSVGVVKTRLADKISKLEREKRESEILASVDEIIRNIANGTLNAEEANVIIQREAKKRVENAPKTKFSLNEEQTKDVILVQIESELAKRPDKYKIIHPETSIKKLQELMGKDKPSIIRAVVENLLNGNEIKEAKSICEEYMKKYKDKNDSFYANMRNLSDTIRNIEIGQCVLSLLSLHGNQDEERMLYERLERGIKSNHINLSAVSLGKNQEGIKTITLAEIWPQEKKR